MNRMRFEFEVLAFAGSKEYDINRDILLTIEEANFKLFISLLKQHFSIVKAVSIISEASKLSSVTGISIEEIIEVAPKFFPLANLLRNKL